MYKKILVPLDGSELAEQVLPQVIELGHCMGAEIILLRVPTPPVYDYIVTDAVLTNEVWEEVERETTAYLARISKELTAQGLQVQTKVGAEGAVHTTILGMAQNLGVDLIAMSTHGRSGLVRLVMGSVADHVVRHAVSPVLLVHPQRGHAESSLIAHLKETAGSDVSL